jgi:hypothetical protein
MTEGLSKLIKIVRDPRAIAMAAAFSAGVAMAPETADAGPGCLRGFAPSTETCTGASGNTFAANQEAKNRLQPTRPETRVKSSCPAGQEPFTTKSGRSGCIQK